MLCFNMRTVERKRLKYAVNQFSVTLYRGYDSTDGGRKYMLIAINAFNWKLDIFNSSNT